MEKKTSRSEFVINRRHRTKYTPQQVEKLERVFEDSQYPDTIMMENLAMDLGVSTERIAIWFQNRRSKFKRQRQTDHMIWMRKQIFQNDHDLLKPAQLPVFSPACHVLSPLEPQITGREHPADLLQSPPTPGYPVPRPKNEASQPVQSPLLPLHGFTVYGSNHSTKHPTVSLGQSQRTAKENREPVFRSSCHAVNITPVISIPTKYSYGRVPFHPVMPGSSLNHTVALTPVSRYQLHLSEEDTLYVNQTTPRSYPVQLNNQDHQSPSVRSRVSHTPHESLKTSQPQNYLQENSASSISSSVESVSHDLFADQFGSGESVQGDKKEKELSDMLLKQKALECLAQWC